MKNWTRRLEYPLVQTYAIPWITETFYAASCVLIAFLAILNVAIAGNDVVTELKDSPNVTDSKWWAPSWMPKSLSFPIVPGPCQPLTLPQHSTSIRTNSTIPIFSYTLLNGLGTDQDGNPKWFDSIRYSAEPLQNCEVQNITALINIPDRGHKLTSQIICSINATDSQTPRTLKFSTTFSRMANTDIGQDNILDLVSSYVVPRFTDIKDAQPVFLANGSTPLNILGVLDAFGSELLKTLWARKRTYEVQGNDSLADTIVVKWSTEPTCWRADSDNRCRRKGPETGGIDSWYSNFEGAQRDNPIFITPMNTTIFNYFVALRDAIHLDLGNVNSSTNIFLNKAAFRERILPDPFMNETAPLVVDQPRPNNGTPYSRESFFRTCTWGWGCINGTWTDALLTEDPRQNISRGLPIDDFQHANYATVIDVKYVCPVFKPKKIGSLLVSVFIGTFSMYTALYGAFLFVAPRVDEWYRKKHGLSRFSVEEFGPYSLLAGSCSDQTPPRSLQTSDTVFHPADLYYNDAAPHYDPAPSSYQTSIGRKGALPPGAYSPFPGPHPVYQATYHGNYLPPIASRSTLTLNSLSRRRKTTSINLSPDSDQEVLIPASLEPSERLEHDNRKLTRAATPEPIDLVSAGAEQAVSAKHGGE